MEVAENFDEGQPWFDIFEGLSAFWYYPVLFTSLLFSMFSLTPAAVLMRHLRWDTPLWGSGPLDVLVSMCPVS